MSQNPPYKISEYIKILNVQLHGLGAVIIGEIFERNIAQSGHVYFTLKDKDTGEILPCLIWRSAYSLCGVELEIGLEVQVTGAPNFTGRFGKLSFIAEQIVLVGEGALKKAYDKLLKKLTAEGLLDPARKRPLPAFPKKIGVITSVHGAVIHDFNNNLRHSGFQVKILDCRVEGPESGKPLAQCVRAMRNQDLDLLVLIRGGGSMQSLAGYNNEAFVRAIATFPVPVVTGIGHHQDVPLACLVSDATQSTPSLAATLVSSSWHEVESRLITNKNIIFNAFENILSSYSGVFTTVLYKIKAFKTTISEISSNLTRVLKDLKNNYLNALKTTHLRLAHLDQLITLHDPQRQLRLGYSIVFAGKKVVRSIKNLKTGQPIEIRLNDGTISSEINKLSS